MSTLSSLTLLGILIIFHFVASSLSFSQYRVTNVSQQSSKLTLEAEYKGTEKYYGNSKNPIITHIVFELQILTFNDFHFKIRDKNNQLFKIPEGGLFHKDPKSEFNFPYNFSSIAITYTTDPFDFRIFRRENNNTIFSTFSSQFVFSKYYLQIGSQIQSQYIFGLGQRFNQGLRIKNGKWTIFSRGRGSIIDQGQGYQTYGYYPFYLLRQTTGHFHSMYLRSSNAMDVMKSQSNNLNKLIFKIIGGIFDFRVAISNKNGLQHLSRVNQYLCDPIVPPFWSFGFHQSRFGYQNITSFHKVIEGYETNNIPLDTLWFDIDYMEEYQDFTIDQKRFPIESIKQILSRYKIVSIIDPGIYIDSESYIQGAKRNVFTKDAKGSQLRGLLWPGETTFVDFFHPNSSTYWNDMLNRLFQKVNFSGIWLDMNQITQFCAGACEPPEYPSQFDYSVDLPYNPGQDNIQTWTISLNSTHYNNLKQADVHIYMSLLQSSATYQFLKRNYKRPFVLSRSTTFGSNKYAFHWTGDNYADFEFLKGSISDMILSYFSGIPMSGADICGFGGNTTVQLCSRWFQLGVLYPFSRNHNTLMAIGQQPYALGQVVLKSATNNIKLRYSLLKYYYTQFILNEAIILPLFLEFQNIQNLDDQVLDTQFLLSKSILAAPIVEKGKTSRNVFFPSVKWYNLYTGQLFNPGYSQIQNVSLIDKVPLFLRENHTVFVQNPENVKNTKDLKNVYSLVAGFSYVGYFAKENYELYHSGGEISSISDFEDEDKLSKCILNKCKYRFDLNLYVYKDTGKKQIQLTVGTGSLITLQDLLLVEQVVCYFNNQKAQAKLKQNLKIQGKGIFNISIENEQLIMKNQQKQENLREVQKQI